jgi:hypothetical protein
MNKIIDYIEAHFKIIAFVLISICLAHGIIGFYKDVSLLKSLLYFGISVGLFFLTWGMVFLVLGVQNINPFCPKSVFKFFCYFIILFGLFGTILGLISDTILSIIKPVNEYNEFAMSLASFGFVSSAIYLYRKYYTKENTTKKKMNKYKNSTDKLKLSPEIIGILFAALGFVWLTTSGILFVRQEVVKDNSIETEGVVIDSVEIKVSEENILFKTKYSYLDLNGKEHIKIGTSGSYPKEYENGTKLKVYYKKNNYDNAIYEGKTSNIIYLFFGIGGFVFIAFGLIFYFAYKNKGKSEKKSLYQKKCNERNCLKNENI